MENEMRKLIIFILMLLPMVAQADEWSKKDIGLEAAYLGVWAMDWKQTQMIARNPDRFYEANMYKVIGRNPSVNHVNQYFLAGALLHVAIVNALPEKYRTVFQAVSISSEVVFVKRNYSIGLTVKF